MTYSHISTQFWQQGYVVLEDFYTVQQMDSLQQKILNHYGSSPDYAHDADFLSKSATEVIPWFPQLAGETEFDPIEQDPRLSRLCDGILGEGWRSLYCMSMFSKQGSKGQAWHQDCPPENAKQFNLNRLVYTMDIDDTVGGQVIVRPGSHRQGALSVGALHEDFADQVTLSPKKGTLVLIHGHTWHRVLPVKGAFRVSTNFRAVPQGTADDITDICVYRNMRYQFSKQQVIEQRM